MHSEFATDKDPVRVRIKAKMMELDNFIRINYSLYDRQKNRGK